MDEERLKFLDLLIIALNNELDGIETMSMIVSYYNMSDEQILDMVENIQEINKIKKFI